MDQPGAKRPGARPSERRSSLPRRPVLSRAAGSRKGRRGSTDYHGIQFPYGHDLAALLTRLEKGTSDLPKSVREAERLTRFAVEARYPGAAAPLSPKRGEEPGGRRGAMGNESGSSAPLPHSTEKPQTAKAAICAAPLNCTRSDLTVE
jgi:HEPN domain